MILRPVAVRSPDDESACRVHQEIILPDHPSFGKDVGNHGCHKLADVGLAGIRIMLCRQYDFLRALRTTFIVVKKRDLAF